jgi:hypothetical protein
MLPMMPEYPQKNVTSPSDLSNILFMQSARVIQVLFVPLFIFFFSFLLHLSLSPARPTACEWVSISLSS